MNQTLKKTIIVVLLKLLVLLWVIGAPYLLAAGAEHALGWNFWATFLLSLAYVIYQSLWGDDSEGAGKILRFPLTSYWSQALQADHLENRTPPPPKD